MARPFLFMAATWKTLLHPAHLHEINLAEIESHALRHGHTALAPVYWELIEPPEGRVDFETVDGVIEGGKTEQNASGSALVQQLEE